MTDLSLSEVWYRPEKKSLSEFLAMKDVGTLRVVGKRLEFSGAAVRLVIEEVIRSSYGKQGTDFINNWVRIDYDDAGVLRTAYFADGGWLGWRGTLGGTRRIHEAIRRAAVDSDDR